MRFAPFDILYMTWRDWAANTSVAGAGNASNADTRPRRYVVSHSLWQRFPTYVRMTEKRVENHWFMGFTSRCCWFVIFVAGLILTTVTLVHVIMAYYDYDITTTMTLKKYTNVSSVLYAETRIIGILDHL